MMPNFSSEATKVQTGSTDKVIVIGCSLTGYAVIRALADMDIYIIAITYEKRDVAQLSRYVSEVMHSPSPDDEEGFVQCLLQNIDRWSGALLLETGDSAAIALSKNKERLSKYYRIATPDWDVLNIFIEKEKTYALAKQFDIPHPKSIPLSGVENIRTISDILYPCILKPVLSSPFTSKFHTKNFEVNNDAELREKFKLCQDAGLSMILQEIIPGPDDNIYKMQGYINSQGRLVGKFFYRKLRQHPPQFGIARVGISTYRLPEVERLTEELLTRANYRGYFSNEFKLDPRDGLLKLIENNCRMPRSGMLATACGINFPWLIYEDLVLNQQSDITKYKVGTYWIDFWTDLYNSLFRRKKEDIRLRDYLGPYFARNKVFSDLDFKDIKPFLGVAYQCITGGLELAFGRRVNPPHKQIGLEGTLSRTRKLYKSGAKNASE
jgi:predicted ATP-grasp superfamily ATP-dependent carboligase